MEGLYHPRLTVGEVEQVVGLVVADRVPIECNAMDHADAVGAVSDFIGVVRIRRTRNDVLDMALESVSSASAGG